MATPRGMEALPRMKKPPTPVAPPSRVWRTIASVFRVGFTVAFIVLLAAGAFFGYEELQHSRYQARWISDFASAIAFSVEPGPAPKPLPPDRGPYDIRLGYAGLPGFAERLGAAGYGISLQARPSPRLQELSSRGVFNVYPEKTQAGLRLLDMHGEPMHAARYPRNVYANFRAIPDLVARTLLYVEDRELLDPGRPTLNPVVDWERLLRAVGQQAVKSVSGGGKVIGASTLATQLEKFRHSPDGITHDARDKLYQMVSGSLRVYRQGEYTLDARRQLLLDYLNAMPLAAQPGYGEVSSLGDGIEAWYGTPFAEFNAALASPDTPLEQKATFYKELLSLVLAVRRPSGYLGPDISALEELTDSYLRRMAADGVIPRELSSAAQAVKLVVKPRADAPPPTDFTRQKGVNLVRNQLLGLLDVRSYYELDRLDLTAATTLDAEVQRQVSEFLRGLRSPERIEELGLTGARLLKASDPSKVIYSLTLYERGEGVNRLRINADNLDQPLDINAGAKLDLGSTSKLRTLTTWLELIAGVHADYIHLPPDLLALADLHPRDRLSAWVRDYLLANPGASLEQTLQAAMQRSYSASPGQAFYTGGGLHHFGNFESSDNHKVLTVAESLRRSVNLVFIRLMREVIDHYMFRAPSTTARLLENADDPDRETYLRRFADREGNSYLRRFYQKHAGKPREESLRVLLEGARATPRAITVALRAAAPEATPADLDRWLRRMLPDATVAGLDVQDLYTRYAVDKFNLNDRGYLARVHPLELWLVDYLAAHPDASLDTVIAAGAEVRQEVYRWLMKTSRRRAQDRRILDLLEIEAFQELHAAWRRVGYPFASLTPSLATAIGSSGDRPAALAELMGIIVNGGVRHRAQLVDGLHFAQGTPYEVRFAAAPSAGEQVMDPVIARTLRAALIDVAENGTARALQSYLKRPDGSRHIAGGKTGTGDHRFEVYGAGGRLISSRVVNRVATFMFLLDDHFYGTITAFVPGEQAAHYEFTSGLPVRLLGALMPILSPLLEQGGANAAAGVEDAAAAEQPAPPPVSSGEVLPTARPEGAVPAPAPEFAEPSDSATEVEPAAAAPEPESEAAPATEEVLPEDAELPAVAPEAVPVTE